MSLFSASRLGNIKTPLKKTMSYVMETNSQVNRDDDLISQERADGETNPV